MRFAHNGTKQRRTHLRDDLAIEGDEGTTIIVQPSSVAALLVGVQVHTAALSTQG